MKNSCKRQNNFIEIFKWVETIFIAIVISLLIRVFIFEPVIVSGTSMEDTLLNDEKLIIYKLDYFFRPPKRGDIIVLQYQKGFFNNISILNKLNFANKIIPSAVEIDYIKRVVGVPGDEINIKDGYVYVNGEKLEENYTKGETHKHLLDFPMIVPQDTVFVLGDNRQNSRDSRIIGFIEYGKIKGKAVLKIWPFKDLGVIK